MSENIFIPERFRRVMSLHIIKNYLRKTNHFPPLLLGIHGPSGDGKTYQCEEVLKEIGAEKFVISVGELESPHAGKPAEIIRTIYLKAGEHFKKKKSVAVILINDMDTGLGDWGDMVQYTTNRQTVFGELMNLVDHPTYVEGMATERIPIIITGNDFTKLYEPLVRAGRMTAFEWYPTTKEKETIISKIFPELDQKETIELVCEFQNQPIAFFSHLKTTLIDDILWQEIQTISIQQFIKLIRNGKEPEIPSNIQYDSLVKAGNQFLQSGQLINHLSKG